MSKVKIPKNVMKKIDSNEWYDVDTFIKDCKCYVASVKSGRILMNVTHVSKSGMSRNISVTSYEGTMTNGYYRQYTAMFVCLGLLLSSDDCVKVSGCGMDMVWDLNYRIIRSIHSFGLITKKSCDVLSQKVNG